MVAVRAQANFRNDVDNNQEALRKEAYVKSALYRYSVMMGSFVGGIMLASVTPLAVLVNPAMQFSSMICFLMIFLSYGWKALAAHGSDTVENFFSEGGFGEVAVGLSTAFLFAAPLMIYEILAPGALLTAAVVTVGVIVGCFSHIMMSQIAGHTKHLEGIEGYARGISKTLLAILVAAMFVKGIALVAGLPLAACGVELALGAVFGLILFGNIFNVLENGYIVLEDRAFSLFGNKNSVICTSPSYGALVLFANSVDLFVTLAKAFFLYKVDKENKVNIWTDIGARLIASGMLFLGVMVVHKMISDSLYASKPAPAVAPVNPGVRDDVQYERDYGAAGVAA